MSACCSLLLAAQSFYHNGRTNQTLASDFGFMELAYFFLPPATGCSCVGIVGATLGGGIGYYSGLHGVISDSLLSARIITGKGELLTASATSNSHLFWAIKGAGFNYGVVTEATFQLYDQTNGGEAMNADMMFPASANGSVWKAIAGFVGNQPKELSLNAAVVFRPGTGVRMIPLTYHFQTSSSSSLS